jgi:hypothetical protein
MAFLMGRRQQKSSSAEAAAAAASANDNGALKHHNTMMYIQLPVFGTGVISSGPKTRTFFLLGTETRTCYPVLLGVN